MSIFTLGHSTLTQKEFVQAARGIDVIIDVRSHPGSRHVPHFSRLEMEEWLPDYGLQYEWWPVLGGWTGRHWHLVEEMRTHGVDLLAYASKHFPKQRIAATRDCGEGPGWTNQGLYDYSWYMTLGEFLEGMLRLIESFGQRQHPRAALVCSESTWWRCHRSMLADYLTFRHVPCYHLPTRIPKRETTSRFTLHQDVIGNRLERYEPEILQTWIDWSVDRLLSKELS